ncbi:MAG: OmpA family protein [Phaeodactylibacter sp.]|nr:OmpA family protein [Phaeodactylibacter sp.]
MRKLTLLALLATALWGSAAAQQKPAVNAVSAKILFVDYGNPNSVDSLSITNGIEFGYLRKINRWLNVGLPVKVGLANVADDANNNRIFASLDGILQVQFARTEDTRVIPYIMGGGGMVWEKDLGTNLQIPMGAGLNIRVAGRSFVNIQAEYRLSQEEKRSNIQAGLGLVHYLGKVDSDGDGVADVLDLCPNEVGPASTGGCPDQDLDGIADREDQCPARPGKKRFNGCPDTDDDKVPDHEDDCPDTPGLEKFRGCPDTDKDGIPDKDDDCPEEKGDASAKGCPDSDGDGIVNSKDKCPDVAGLAQFGGCPFADKDGDKVPDDKDQCPDKPGRPDMDGCPDTDKDGIHDGKDSCPEQAGPESNKGCPELKKEEREVLNFAMRAVQFETGKAALKEESFAVLNQIVDIMNRYPGYKLRIGGHTDNVGEEQSNQILSEERAKACYQYLASKGVSPGRMSFEGFGESKPVASNDLPSGRRMNRRVEFDLYID